MLKFLLEKEFKQIFRNPFLPKMILMLPLVMLLLIPWAANQEVKNIQLCVIDNDRSSCSERLIHKLSASKNFILSNLSDSYSEAMSAIESNQVDVVLEIPPAFEKELVREGIVKVMISANAVNGTKGVLSASYLSSILTDYSNELKVDFGQLTGKEFAPSIHIVPYNKFNIYLDYKFFMIPAIIVMLLTLITGFLPAFNIVGEKEVGTIEQMNVTPVGRLYFILGKLIPYWIIGFVVLSIGCLVAALVYGLFPVGNLLWVYVYAALYILAVSGMGLIISNYSETMQQAMFLMFFFILILVLLSGLFTPISSMPQWAQWIARFNPLSYFMEIMRGIYLQGSSFKDLLPQLLALCGFAVALNTWAVLSYKKSH